MRKAYSLSFLLLLLIPLVVFAQEAQPGDPGLGDSLYPSFGNGGYDVQHYTLDLTVDPESGSLEGITTIDAAATQDLSRFNLDLIGFSVDGVTVDGTDAAFARDERELTITPAEAIANGATFTVEVRYSGVPEDVTSIALPVLTGWVRYGDEEPCPCNFALSEPDGAANFYPVNDHPLDKATYTIRVTVPKPYNVAANGNLIDMIDNGDTTTTVTEVTAPMASYLTTINISQFDVVTEEGENGVPIRNYFEVGLGDEYRDLFARQDEMIGYFESLFGEYPFDVYGSVVVNVETGSALETQTLSIFGIDILDLDDVEFSQQVVAHELAHQWFGDSISLADWSDIWLNEGFASYAEGLWVEHDQGREGLEAWVRDNYDYIASDDFPAPGKPAPDDLFNYSVYTWGALALHALRERVGDEAFFEILQTWYERYKDSNATTADFVAVASEVSGEDLTDFFNDWIYSGELPPIPELGLGE